MQEIKMRLRVDSTTTQQIDDGNQSINKPPSIVRGMQCNLVLELVDSSFLPIENLDYSSWDFVLADDWLSETPVQMHVSNGITVQENFITIPLLETDNVLLEAKLANLEEITLGAELAGFDESSESPRFLIQFNISIRNRRGTTRPDSANYDFPFTVVNNFLLSDTTVEELPLGKYKLGTFDVTPSAIEVVINEMTFVENIEVNNCRLFIENNAIYFEKTGGE